jgi:hypothetical protein
MNMAKQKVKKARRVAKAAKKRARRKKIKS